MAVLAAGQSRPLCLKAALAHVTLHTSWALCPGSPTPDRGWQWCQGQGEGCLDTLVEPGGSLEREREPEAHTAEFPNSGITHSDVSSTPHWRGCLYSALWEEEHSTEKQRGSGHLIIWGIWKEPELSSRASASWIRRPSQSPQVFTSCPAGRGRNMCRNGAESRGYIDRGPPSLALPSMMESHVKEQASKSQGFWSTQGSQHGFSSLTLACCRPWGSKEPDTT